MPDDALAFPDERRPARGKQGHVVFGKSDGGPCDRVRESLVYARAQHLVGIDPRAFHPRTSATAPSDGRPRPSASILPWSEVR